MKSDLPAQTLETMRRLAGEAIVAGNPRHEPFLDAVANPIQMLALLDMVERATQALREEDRGT